MCQTSYRGLEMYTRSLTFRSSQSDGGDTQKEPYVILQHHADRLLLRCSQGAVS